MLPQQLASVTDPEASTSEYNLVENISVRPEVTASQSHANACCHPLLSGNTARFKLCLSITDAIIRRGLPETVLSLLTAGTLMGCGLYSLYGLWHCSAWQHITDAQPAWLTACCGCCSK